jgi:four helix bundle protein
VTTIPPQAAFDGFTFVCVEVVTVPESFKNLVVWQRAVEMTVQVYNLTSVFPDLERFGLTNQLRRAAVSTVSNIAEGYGRSSKGEYIQFLGHARGSSFEVETQLTVAHRLGFGSEKALATAQECCAEVGKMLTAMIVSLRRKS